MKISRLYWATWAVCFASFIAACSQGELSPIEPQEIGEEIQTGSNKTEADTNKATTDTTKTAPDTSKASPDTVAKDSLSIKKDTLYIRDTVTLYKDTVDRINEIAGKSYTVFLTQRPSGAIDTVVRRSEYLTCDMGDESFTCSYSAPETLLEIRYYEKIRIDSTLIRNDSTVCIIHVTDTLYKDTLYKDTYKALNDTTYLNYGDSRQTDYIPPKYIYEPGEHPFDSTAMRDFFDTLDLRDAKLGGKNTLKINSQLSFNGFPLVDDNLFITVLKVEALYDIDGPSFLKNQESWPTKTTAISKTYSFSNTGIFVSDTTITWTLGYTHYESGIEEKDSIQVTTFFKVE